MSEPIIINTVDDLRAEIARLKVVKHEQEAAIKEHFSSPMAVINTVFGSKSKSGFFKVDDIVSLVSRFVLPFTLNKTIFRNSNFIIKTLVGLVSQQASGFINEKSISSVWDTVRSFISKKRTAKNKDVDYGIPPLSETY
jgi:hypothetical protein